MQLDLSMKNFSFEELSWSVLDDAQGGVSLRGLALHTDAPASDLHSVRGDALSSTFDAAPHFDRVGWGPGSLPSPIHGSPLVAVGSTFSPSFAPAFHGAVSPGARVDVFVAPAPSTLTTTPSHDDLVLGTPVDHGAIGHPTPLAPATPIGELDALGPHAPPIAPLPVAPPPDAPSGEVGVIGASPNPPVAPIDPVALATVPPIEVVAPIAPPPPVDVAPPTYVAPTYVAPTEVPPTYVTPTYDGGGGGCG